MCRKLTSLISFVLVLSLAVAVADAQPLNQDPGADGIVSVEAEHFDDNIERGGAKWEEIGPTAGFTGTAGMQALGAPFWGSDYATASPQLDYEINFVKTGTHYVWILAWGASTSNDSCHVGLDGEATPLSDRMTGWYNDYEWNTTNMDEPRSTFEVTSTGVHTLNIWMREDGLIVDKIVLTTNPDFMLIGSEPGPRESIRGPREMAARPSPADGAVDVPRDMVLSWTPGIYVPPINGHTIYFGENFTDVNDGIGGITQDTNSYDPGRLDWGTTYYWRVDEVNGPPDYTVYEGKVWEFTTEPFAYPIENVTATASSSERAKWPEDIVNGSGLDDSGLLHSKEADSMWLSSLMGVQPTWIEFQFDRIYRLHEMWVWNYNNSLEPTIGVGFKDVAVEYSQDGTTYVTLGTTQEFGRGPGMPDYAHNTTIEFGGVPAKHVRLTANSNWGGMLNQYGLSEVRFFFIPVNATEPYPDSGAVGVPPNVVLTWVAGREAVTHDVYISTDEQAVIEGTASVTTVTETSYGPLSLDSGKTYYWRVDEFDGVATHKGDVWSFRTLPSISITDPNLVGWWKLDDEGTGAVVVDYSGYDHHGRLHGDPQYVAGYDGDALELDGDDYVTIDGYKGVTGTHAYSIAAWIQTSGNGEIVGWGSSGGGNRMEFRVSGGRLRHEPGNGNTQGDTNLADGEWHHVAVTVRENSSHNDGVTIYLDGEVNTRANNDSDPVHPVADFDVIFGQRYNQTNDRWFTGLIDDVRIYDKALTQDEIRHAMTHY